MEPVTAQEVMDSLNAKDLTKSDRSVRVLRSTVVAMIAVEVMKISKSRPEPPPEPVLTRRQRVINAFKSGQNLYTWQQHILRALLWCFVIWLFAWILELPRDGRILFVCWISMVLADWFDAILLLHNSNKDKKSGT